MRLNLSENFENSDILRTFEQNLKTETMKEFGLFIARLVFVFPLYIWSGFVFMKLWGWFISPIFDIEPISLIYAIGIGLTVGLITKSVRSSDADDKDYLKSWLIVAIHPSFTLFIGWIFSMYM